MLNAVNISSSSINGSKGTYGIELLHQYQIKQAVNLNYSLDNRDIKLFQKER